MKPPAWGHPPRLLVVDEGEVHVWRVRLDLELASVQRLEQHLSPDERDRAARFHFERDRRHFTVARGRLRALLAGYVDARPDQIRFRYTSYGKPFLDSSAGLEALRFNLSHSHELALIAVTHGREIGIDLEYVRTDLADEPIAERFFSAREVTALLALPPTQRPIAFFHCWTRKEAYIKARGEGLSFPLDAFDVSLAPNEPAALLCTRGDPDEAARWSLRALEPGPGYVAALAVEGHDWRLQCWEANSD